MPGVKREGGRREKRRGRKERKIPAVVLLSNVNAKLRPPKVYKDGGGGVTDSEHWGFKGVKEKKGGNEY